MLRELEAVVNYYGIGIRPCMLKHTLLVIELINWRSLRAYWIIDAGVFFNLNKILNTSVTRNAKSIILDSLPFKTF